MDSDRKSKIVSHERNVADCDIMIKSTERVIESYKNWLGELNSDKLHSQREITRLNKQKGSKTS